jgi:hypothetical protein
MEIKEHEGHINKSEDLVAFIVIEQERGSRSEATIESSRAMMEVGSQGNGYAISTQTYGRNIKRI